MYQAIKNYQVEPKYIRDDGSLDPDAPLLGEFAMQYRQVGGRPETYSSEDVYDNSTNVHGGRHFDIYSDGFHALGEGDRLLKENMHVKNRGYSVAGYTRGRGKWNNVFYGWNRARRSDERYRALKEAWEKLHPGTDYELHSIKHDSSAPDDDRRFQEMLDTFRAEGDDETADWQVNNRNSVEKQRLIDHTFGGHGNLKFGADLIRTPDKHIIRTVHLPFIVGFNDDDVVSFDDVMERGYDPARDYDSEVQLKAIRMKRLPSGLIVPVNDSSVNDMYNNVIRFINKVFDSIDDIYRRRHSADDSLMLLHRGIGNVTKESFIQQMTDNAEALRRAMSEVAYEWSKIRSMIEDNNLDLTDSSSGIGSRLSVMDEAFRSVCDDEALSERARGLVSDDSHVNQVNGDIRYIDRRLNLVYPKMIAFCDRELMSELRWLDSVCKSKRVAFRNDNGVGFRVIEPDWNEFLDREFSPEDERNISDYHKKYIKRDFSNWYRNNRRTREIADGIRDRRYR